MTTVAAAVTLDEAVRAGAARLRAAGIATPQLDARVLAADATALDMAGLIAHGRTAISPDDADRLDALIARRAAGEPVARILGRREFWGLEFALNAATLIPRPDSETLVEAALALIDAGPGRAAPMRIADLGTGSGCLLIALLTELPCAWGIGTDISLEALSAASDNARRNRVGERARFVRGSWAEPIDAGVDVIVTNPPYIEHDAVAALAREVAHHEPRVALDGGADGFSAYRALLPSAARALRPDGMLLLEHGAGQEAVLAGLIEGCGMAVKGRWRDLAGVDRVIACGLDARWETEAGRAAALQKLLGKDRRTG